MTYIEVDNYTEPEYSITQDGEPIEPAFVTSIGGSERSNPTLAMTHPRKRLVKPNDWLYSQMKLVDEHPSTLLVIEGLRNAQSDAQSIDELSAGDSLTVEWDGQSGEYEVYDVETFRNLKQYTIDTGASHITGSPFRLTLAEVK